jgi:nucleoside-diphosphate-sugar epimerase
MKRIVVNGANGYVASHFINALLKKGFPVSALVRSGQDESAREKLLNSLQIANGGSLPSIQNLEVLDYHLTQEYLGLSSGEVRRLFQGEVDYYHFAASLKFNSKSRSEIFATNVDGLDRSLAMFAQSASSKARFLYIGTAYSCGIMKGAFREQFYPDAGIESFRNYYEQSKRMAENRVRMYMEKYGIKSHVIRLSQVVGHSRTGVTNTGYGVFDFTRRLARLSRNYPQKRIRVRIDPQGTQNMIPVDSVVKQLMQATTTNDLPVVMNMVASESVPNRYLIEVLNRELPLRLEAAPGLKSVDMGSVERLVAVGMSFTGEYSALNLEFDTTERDRIMGQEAGLVTRESIGRMLSCFLEAEGLVEVAE